MTAPQSHRDLIVRLGGPVRLARALGIDRPMPATVHWSSRGIPARYWHRVAELARDCEIDITPHDIEMMPARSEAAA